MKIKLASTKPAKFGTLKENARSRFVEILDDAHQRTYEKTCENRGISSYAADAGSDLDARFDATALLRSRSYWRAQLFWAMGVSLFIFFYLFTPAAATYGGVNMQSNAAVLNTAAQLNLPAAPLPNPNPNPNPDPGNNPPQPQLVPGEQAGPGQFGPQNPQSPQNPDDLSRILGVFGFDNKPATVVTVFIAITVLSVAPSLLLMMTCFTKIFITLAMSRNAIGLQQIPPNQVLAGLSLFLTLFVMSPVISQVNNDAIQPYLNGNIGLEQAFKTAGPHMRNFMAARTREEDIALITRAASRPNPATLEDVPFTTLVPAFMISEVRSAFIIGFVVFIPFLVIDLVVGASLMSMGMMMLPPVMVSLPFKILLFVMVDGWGLLTQTLIGTYR